MAIIGDALCQAFMLKHEYDCLRDEDKAGQKLQKPFKLLTLTLISVAISLSTIISLKVVFPNDKLRQPFGGDSRIQLLAVNFTEVGGGGSGRDLDPLPGVFVLTDQETVDYYWIVMFIPSAMVFLVSVVYLIAGITVAYTAPARHGCLKVFQNSYYASRRGGVRCLSGLNIVFAIIFGLLALFLVRLSSHEVAPARCLCFGAMKFHYGDWSFWMGELPSASEEK